MVWLSKRELATYVVLREVLGEKNIVNIGEALEVLQIMMPRKIARKVMKRLHKKGFLSIENVQVRINPLDDAIKRLLNNYIAERIRRNLRAQGIEALIEVRGDHIRVALSGEECAKVKSFFDRLIIVECLE
ncbi:MAG: hypothetical protein DRO12_00700 [Thermoprotei archaeon]|nr:MAG: hypothetical protein DRO12_00700 [Thermoprotei archaeon]